MTNSNRAALLAVAAVAAVLIATLVIVQMLGGEEQPAASDQDAAASFEPPPPGECVEPPAMPASPQQFDEVPDQALAEDAVWTATVTTNCGDIVMELDGTKAPQTVASFLHLAREGYWDGSPCHRLVPSGIFVLQCGDPTGTGTGNPGYGFGVENAPADAAYPRGTLAMARSTDPESNGGQFFIVYDDSQIPDNGGTGYTIFGKVTEGMDIVDRIAESGVGGTLGPEAPNQPISIVGIEVEKA
ncbi:MAG TPA: peptidylprolyl isomerase [Nocardioides sp.]|uniref:peptidylprolyl isomerase n=1 Tax=Nocardioides sp. TaxID=35761 RepID=UPI002D7E85B7|nr:peptidylprolyl isomerase [Nocardioides sp.]HET6654224.1 peptidylprolyl isomerase [Nocardioides sp.]